MLPQFVKTMQGHVLNMQGHVMNMQGHVLTALTLHQYYAGIVL